MLLARVLLRYARSVALFKRSEALAQEQPLTVRVAVAAVIEKCKGCSQLNLHVCGSVRQNRNLPASEAALLTALICRTVEWVIVTFHWFFWLNRAISVTLCLRIKCCCTQLEPVLSPLLSPYSAKTSWSLWARLSKNGQAAAPNWKWLWQTYLILSTKCHLFPPSLSLCLPHSCFLFCLHTLSWNKS